MSSGLQKSTHQLETELDKIMKLIESNDFASAFENITAYRIALIDFIQEVTKND